MRTETGKRVFTRSLLALSLSSALLASAAEPEQCGTVRFTDPGWTDINATNGVTVTLLEALGYKTDISLLGVPIGFESLKNGEIDVFLGNWMPAQTAFIDKYGSSVDVIKPNLEGAKFTLAVPKYAYEQGVKDFADLAKFDSDFNRRIYGIDAGAPANLKIQEMIDKNEFGLGDWKVVESGEQAMLSQVARSVRRDKFIVFLAWEPHPMNVNYELAYLTGGDNYFGPNYGGATIYTLTRKNYSDECPNVGQLLSNLTFSLTMENQLIGAILDDGKDAKTAAAEWLKANPEPLEGWLKGVNTTSGGNGLDAVKASLNL